MKIDGVLVVNLETRSERWETFRKNEANWVKAFGQMPIRFPAVYGIELEGYDRPPWFRSRIKDRRKRSWGGKAGAILSHRNAILYAKQQGWENVLILEDDAFLTEEMAGKWQNDLKQKVANIPDDWAAIYLYSAKPFSPFRIIAETPDIRLVETSGAFGCVAYIVNGKIFNELVSALPDKSTIWSWVARYKAIDLWFSRCLRKFGRVYVVAPSLVGHQVGPSDITVTPESEWTFDGEMRNIAYTNNVCLYAIKRWARSLESVYEERISYCRMQIKKIRGL